MLLAIALLVFCLTGQAVAHPDGVSVLKMNLEPTEVRASVSIKTRDLSKWFPPAAYPNYVSDVSRALEKQASEFLVVRLNDSVVPPTSAKATNPETGLLQLDLTYPAPRSLEYLFVENKRLKSMPPGHEVWVFVEDRRSLPPGAKVGPTILQDRLTVELPSTDKVIDNPATPTTPAAATGPADTQPAAQPASTRPTHADRQTPGDSDAGDRRISFFLKGVEHILTGYDHLLFVAALLLACRTFREAATIITFFTIAHSITLTLAATVERMHFDPQVIEPAIAATICFVAIENLIHRPNLRWRCAITFGFGLIHGLGFASDLREMLPGSTFGQVVWPLLKFSAGVETGHLTLVFAALPILLWFKQKHPTKDAIFSPAMSGIISAVGMFWLVTRIWGESSGG